MNYPKATGVFLVFTIIMMLIVSFVRAEFDWVKWFIYTMDGRMCIIVYFGAIGMASLGWSLMHTSKQKQ